MYAIYTVRDTVRVPPKALGEDLNNKILELVQEDYEGVVDEDLGVVLAVINAKKIGEGKIIPGDSMVYYSTEIEMLLYTPVLHEVVEGEVTEVTEFGVFIRTGPIEGLVHRSQIMDDFNTHDAKSSSFIGRESKKKITLGDTVFARTVNVSLKGSISSSKIGYTMRQLGLGKKDWLKLDEKKKEKVVVKERTKEKSVKTDKKEK